MRSKDQLDGLYERLQRVGVDKDAPLRLDVAVMLAYPDGGMTVAGLRLEKKRGNLTVETTAGKDFVTLRSIEEMRERCRAKAKGPTCTSNPSSAADPPGGSSATGLTE